MSAGSNFLQENHIKIHCKNIFYDQIEKTNVKTEKKLDQIFKFLMENLIQIWFKFEFEKISNSSQTHLNLNLKNFQIGLKFESDLSIIFDSFLPVLCEIWVFADLAGI